MALTNLFVLLLLALVLWCHASASKGSRMRLPEPDEARHQRSWSAARQAASLSTTRGPTRLSRSEEVQIHEDSANTTIPKRREGSCHKEEANVGLMQLGLQNHGHTEQQSPQANNSNTNASEEEHTEAIARDAPFENLSEHATLRPTAQSQSDAYSLEQDQELGISQQKPPEASPAPHDTQGDADDNGMSVLLWLAFTHACACTLGWMLAASQYKRQLHAAVARAIASLPGPAQVVHPASGCADAAAGLTSADRAHVGSSCISAGSGTVVTCTAGAESAGCISGRPHADEQDGAARGAWSGYALGASAACMGAAHDEAADELHELLQHDHHHQQQQQHTDADLCSQAAARDEGSAAGAGLQQDTASSCPMYSGARACMHAGRSGPSVPHDPSADGAGHMEDGGDCGETTDAGDSGVICTGIIGSSSHTGKDRQGGQLGSSSTLSSSVAQKAQESDVQHVHAERSCSSATAGAMQHTPAVEAATYIRTSAAGAATCAALLPSAQCHSELSALHVNGGPSTSWVETPSSAWQGNPSPPSGGCGDGGEVCSPTSTSSSSSSGSMLHELSSLHSIALITQAMQTHPNPSTPCSPTPMQRPAAASTDDALAGSTLRDVWGSGGALALASAASSSSEGMSVAVAAAPPRPAAVRLHLEVDAEALRMVVAPIAAAAREVRALTRHLSALTHSAAALTHMVHSACTRLAAVGQALVVVEGRVVGLGQLLVQGVEQVSLLHAPVMGVAAELRTLNTAAARARRAALAGRALQIGLWVMMGSLCASAAVFGRWSMVYGQCTMDRATDENSQSSLRGSSAWGWLAGRLLSRGGGAGLMGGAGSTGGWWMRLGGGPLGTALCMAHQLGLFGLGALLLAHCLLPAALRMAARDMATTWPLDIGLLLAGAGAALGTHTLHYLGGAWTVWLLLWWAWCGTAALLHAWQPALRQDGQLARGRLKTAASSACPSAEATQHECADANISAGGGGGGDGGGGVGSRGASLGGVLRALLYVALLACVALLLPVAVGVLPFSPAALGAQALLAPPLLRLRAAALAGARALHRLLAGRL